jgi:hypothetical protein
LKGTAATLTAILFFMGLTPGRAAVEPQAPPAEASGSTEHNVKELEWHSELPKALAEAREQGKLVFWVQMLGQIDGPT